MEMLQGVWKQHLRPRAVVGYGVKIFLPSPPNYVTRSPGCDEDNNRETAVLLNPDAAVFRARRDAAVAAELRVKDIVQAELS